MDPSTSMAAVVAALSDLVERLSVEFPGGATLVDRVISAGRAVAGEVSVETVEAALSAVLDAGPEGWARLARSGQAWAAGAAAGALDETHPLVESAGALFDRAAALAADMALGDGGASAGFDEAVMGVLDKLGAACVDAMMGGRA